MKITELVVISYDDAETAEAARKKLFDAYGQQAMDKVMQALQGDPAEAKALIQQAYDLSPDDPAVLDSLGWVNFRLGNLDEAERLLRQALERFPDQEVAAHLGEVLWANGKQREAKKIWGTFLKENPDSPILRKTILRLTGSETL